jgi:hypothetical protein
MDLSIEFQDVADEENEQEFNPNQSEDEMSECESDPPTNINAAAAATTAAVNASTITTSCSSTPVAVMGLESIGVTIPNVVASNRRGSSAAQKAMNTNIKNGLRRFSQLNPLAAAQKATNATNQKGLGRFSQLNPHVELMLRPARLTRRAQASAGLLNS